MPDLTETLSYVKYGWNKKALKAAAESIAATDAAKNFGQLVDRVRESGATYVIERHGRPVAQIGPVQAEQPKTLRSLIEAVAAAPRLDEEVLRYIEPRHRDLQQA